MQGCVPRFFKSFFVLLISEVCGDDGPVPKTVFSVWGLSPVASVVLLISEAGSDGGMVPSIVFVSLQATVSRKCCGSPAVSERRCLRFLYGGALSSRRMYSNRKGSFFVWFLFLVLSSYLFHERVAPSGKRYTCLCVSCVCCGGYKCKLRGWLDGTAVAVACVKGAEGRKRAGGRYHLLNRPNESVRCHHHLKV